MTRSRGIRGGSVEKRFWQRVEKHDGGCWRWIGSLADNGYGRMFVGRQGSKRIRVPSHRISWELHYGPVPNGLFVLHHCDNRVCVNPAHLFIGSHQDNQTDKVAKNRQAKGESHGRSRLTEANVHWAREQMRSGRRQTDIARALGVPKGIINDVVKGRTWAHLKEATNDR